jgi:hypothetical protein
MIPGLIAGICNKETECGVENELRGSWSCSIDMPEQILTFYEGNHEKTPENVVVLGEFFRDVMMHILELCWWDGGGKDGGDRRGSVCRIGFRCRDSHRCES